MALDLDMFSNNMGALLFIVLSISHLIFLIDAMIGSITSEKVLVKIGHTESGVVAGISFQNYLVQKLVLFLLA